MWEWKVNVATRSTGASKKTVLKLLANAGKAGVPYVQAGHPQLELQARRVCQDLVFCWHEAKEHTGRTTEEIWIW